jgi:ABC-type Fe3+-hydroxamate transport system substrate-binding protein
MRWILVTGFLVLAILVAGCTQNSAAPVTPTITQSVDLITPTATPTAVIADGMMQINVTVKQSGHDVIITYNGGASAADLVALKIAIFNQNGQVVRRTMTNPTPGDVYTFPYQGTPDPETVDVIGVFTGGVEQTVLQTQNIPR